MMELRDEKEGKDGGPEPTPARQPSEGEPSRATIRCPKCSWEHDWVAHWGCEICEAVFDTFVTHAQCPEKTCGNSWKVTWCPMCQEASPHDDWYVEEPGSSPGSG